MAIAHTFRNSECNINIGDVIYPIINRMRVSLMRGMVVLRRGGALCLGLRSWLERRLLRGLGV